MMGEQAESRGDSPLLGTVAL
ncbi:MAG: hypothetical protein RLZZ171_456, partial [Cyanobacteriota bacterium]